MILEYPIQMMQPAIPDHHDDWTAISTLPGVNIDSALTPSPPSQIVAFADASKCEASCRIAESETISLSDDGAARSSIDTLCSPAATDLTTKAITSSISDDALDSELSSAFGLLLPPDQALRHSTAATCKGTGPQAPSVDITANGTPGPTGLDPRELARLQQSDPKAVARLGRLDPHNDHMQLRDIHQRFTGLPLPFIGPRLPQPPRRRSRTRHKPAKTKKKTLHWPVSRLPRPAPQPPRPPPIPEGTDDDDWTDDDDDHSEDPYPCPSGYDNVWEDYFATRGEYPLSDDDEDFDDRTSPAN